jgi:hypothetical protein
LNANEEYKISVEMDWTNEEVPRDFSVVVHGMSGGTVRLVKDDGAASDTLPVIHKEG